MKIEDPDLMLMEPGSEAIEVQTSAEGSVALESEMTAARRLDQRCVARF